MQRTDLQEAAPEPGSRARWRAAVRRGAPPARALAGPALIVAAVLAISWDTVVAGLITREHLDIPAFWVPTHCYLGQSLREGTIPAWNPFVFTGTPFAADPQSGWMFLLPMLLYTALPCDVAAPLLLVLTPMIGGLGIFLFLRSEGCSRVSATIAGLVLVLSLAGSRVGLSFPFVSTLAWTAVALWAASRLLRTSRWSSRILWATATAALWGQIVSSHGSQGQLVGTATLAAFLLARAAGDVVRRRRGPGAALGLGALVIVAIVAVNLAILAPRAAVLPRAATSLGNATLDRLSREAVGAGGPQVKNKEGKGGDPGWPAKLLLPRGAYVGLAVLGLVALAPWTRRHRALALAMGIYGLAAYALSLKDVADVIAARVGGGVLLDVLYLHQPWRLAIGVVPAVAVLAAIGVDAWCERPLRTRLVMLVAAVLVVAAICLRLPEAASLAPGLLVAGVVALLLLGSIRVPLALTGAAVLVAVELGGNVLAGSRDATPLRSRDFGLGILPPGMTAVGAPDLDAGAYLRPTRFAQELGGAAEPVRYQFAGSFHHQMMTAGNWPALAEQRSMLFRVEGVDGYNPFQLRRFWLYSRRVNTQAQKYNVTSFPEAPSTVLDTLGVTHVISPADASPSPDTPAPTPVATDGRWVLSARSDAAPRAELFTSWTVVGSEDEALDAVVAPRSGPLATLVLEREPGIAPDPGAAAGSAVYRWDGTQAATVEVDAGSASMLLIRNAYDPGWRATIDGRSVPVLAANAISLGVAVPAGSHVVQIEYREPWIAVGLLGSAVSAAALVSGALWLRRRERRSAVPGRRPHARADDGPTVAR